ncbi:symmetrical bis(5'-nucleosyl)-tetraphosphatase [Sulfuriflexus mobilis]|uniref:symmetrical bis(5'-nucleosyl)-tetraphosphatase n=1 Tax=Sulfuriflexus mobilis TaxID=1811807 RepID=UPI000F81FFEE|nr:symmetrical bis(5'-nucleosyl)-tetraphosphatase [Sulfuriflexus mobilis]
MATYAIGDIQGCLNELQRLLEHIDFDTAADRLWLVGDLVNRGPDSAGVLRLILGLGDRATIVLGNHDLHLLAVAEGHLKYAKHDNLHDVIEAEDGVELLYWLRHLPLMHHDGQLGLSMVHAGLPPQWDLATAQACAKEVEAVLQGPDYVHFLEHMYGNLPDRWDDNLEGLDRLRFITNCFSRLRYCDEHGRLALDEKGPPGSQPAGYAPWFELKGRRTREHTILFGHWSSLGFIDHDNVYGLDTGCLWGHALTALRLEDRRIFSIDCPGARKPHK